MRDVLLSENSRNENLRDGNIFPTQDTIPTGQVTGPLKRSGGGHRDNIDETFLYHETKPKRKRPGTERTLGHHNTTEKSGAPPSRWE